MRLIKLFSFILFLIFPISSFAVFWGSVSNNGQTGQFTGGGPYLYEDILSVENNGLLDSSNQFQLVFPNLESKSPYLHLTRLEINFYVGLTRYQLVGSECLKLNQPCNVQALTGKEITELLSSTSKVRYEVIMTVLNDDVFGGAVDHRFSLQYKSNKTQNEFVNIDTNISFRVIQRYSCLAKMDNLEWNIGKVAPAQINLQPISIKIAGSGTKQGKLRFKSSDIKNGVLTMRDGDRIGPSIVFSENRGWEICDDDSESVCILHRPSQVAAATYRADVNSLQAEPGKYTSYITSTVECN